MPELILPAHVGERRYGPRRPPAPDPNEQRPLYYTAEVAGRQVIIANATDIRLRIPVDELRAMALEQEKKRERRGDAQKKADWDRVLLEYGWDRLNAREDRRRGRVNFGPATFRGNRAR